jgi:hypothetical protein
MREKLIPKCDPGFPAPSGAVEGSRPRDGGGDGDPTGETRLDLHRQGSSVLAISRPKLKCPDRQAELLLTTLVPKNAVPRSALCIPPMACLA